MPLGDGLYLIQPTSTVQTAPDTPDWTNALLPGLFWVSAQGFQNFKRKLTDELMICAEIKHRSVSIAFKT